MALRELESVIRWGLSDIQRYQRLSDDLIVPNLDQDISFFYDPATKKLRRTFRNLSPSSGSNRKIRSRLGSDQTELVRRIQAERQQSH